MGKSRDGIVDDYDTVQLKCRLLGETERALHVAITLPSGVVKTLWLPKSQCQYYSDMGHVLMPEWLAEKHNV